MTRLPSTKGLSSPWCIARSDSPTAAQCDIMVSISEVVVGEQMLIRNLPEGTKAALRVRAQRNRHSVEAEVRGILADALEREPVTLVDLLAGDNGAEIDFEPGRLRLTARTPEL